MEKTTMRDDFTAARKVTLARRVGMRCSNPSCRRLTSGPEEDPNQATNIGVAAHITGASPGGPRYDPSLSHNERNAIENGIWLCQNCAKLIDDDPARYSVKRLHAWRLEAEARALEDMENGASSELAAGVDWARLWTLMPDLLGEMREDLRQYPISREFIVLKKSWVYWGRGTELAYFYDDHPELDNKLHILANFGLIQEITHNNTKRFVISEGLAKYLELS